MLQHSSEPSLLQNFTTKEVAGRTISNISSSGTTRDASTSTVPRAKVMVMTSMSSTTAKETQAALPDRGSDTPSDHNTNELSQIQLQDPPSSSNQRHQTHQSAR